MQRRPAPPARVGREACRRAAHRSTGAVISRSVGRHVAQSTTRPATPGRRQRERPQRPSGGAIGDATDRVVMPSSPVSMYSRVPKPPMRSSTYGLFAPSTSWWVVRSPPSGPGSRSSGAWPSGPNRSGSRVQRSRDLRRRGTRSDCTISPYTPSDTLLTKTRSFTTPRSTGRSIPSANASSDPTTSVTVDAEVEREVVAGAGRDADERQIVLGGDLRHDRLRAAAGPRVHHQDGMPGRRPVRSADAGCRTPGQRTLGPERGRGPTGR